MTGLLDLKEHLVFYRSYHTNPKNVNIHLICIPIILTSAIAILATFALSNPYLNLGAFLISSFGTFYVLLDWKVGIPTACVYGTFAYAFTNYYHFVAESPLSYFTQPDIFKFAVFVHVVAWLAQFYGHKFHEQRAPALLDNLLGALVLAPYFVSFEVAFWLGFRQDIKEYMDKGAAQKRLEFMRQQSTKKTQ
ncbi:hypothetical protein PSN45_001419 [Yamadazyma tenuis]|uniref:DUF962-domain-containing protein n=1 Tax=Candida tenuis (strain ATCC 10573 / BCRC 21748 / CBS 615 / JCM 9827 / NBRC 10315 / NRRL Y-1498 / VKM Y-70) TaxID=590646 RepID=G3BC52_CANTC|nr:DUF962-domain-containing protein [Yamadazyma tenuis ATCC 10573]EGV60789.1 DUF962-domain-containing protein [Yamadazyma tenuis ATCC 10573]WEJ93942.1 hypothetical protein PSN45_001419 [Yamadazyma tenuis]